MFRKISLLIFIVFFSCNFAVAQQKVPTSKYFNYGYYEMKRILFKNMVDPRKFELFGVKLEMPFSQAEKAIGSLKGFNLVGSDNRLDGANQIINVYKNPTTKEEIRLYGSKDCKTNNVIVGGIVHNFGDLSWNDKYDILNKYLNKHGQPTDTGGWIPKKNTWNAYWYLYKSHDEFMRLHYDDTMKVHITTSDMTISAIHLYRRCKL